MPIPSELLDYKQWILWRRTEVNGRIAKLPISPWSGKLASCDKPQTWSTYRHVCYARRKFRSDGVGFVFTSSDPFCGIDLDQCRTRDGKIVPNAQAVIDRVASYAEVSPSGVGIHILVRAKLPRPGRRTGKLELLTQDVTSPSPANNYRLALCASRIDNHKWKNCFVSSSLRK
jgi:putative DNA primase/helicase